MRCTSCDRDAQPDDVFCASCGHELVPPTCPRCATVSRSDAHFCVSCGADLGNTPGVGHAPSAAQPQSAEPSPRAAVARDEHLVFEEDPGPPLWEVRLAPPTGLPARNEPDVAAPVITELAPDTQLLVLEESDQWAKVSVESGRSGWVDARRLVDPDLPGAPPHRTTGRC